MQSLIPGSKYHAEPRRHGGVGRCCALVVLFLLSGCASGSETPGAAWLLGATVRSLAGVPPTPADFYAAPVKVSETLKFTAIAAGADHTCAIAVDGDTYCWGSNQYRQLGSAVLTETCSNGRLSCSSTPVRLEAAPRFTALAASMWGTCGLDASGGAHCWGFGLGGRTGDSLPAGSGAPVEVPGDHELAALTSSPSGSGTCGLTPTGRAWCWSASGGASSGGPLSGFTGPDAVAASSPFASISFGGQHGCGIDEERSVSCWGGNQFGQLGIGSSALEGGIAESPTPVMVHGELKLEQIVAGAGHSCGLDAQGPLYCWGLGFPIDTNSPPRNPERRSIPHGSLPVLLETPDPKWVTLGAGTSQTCGLSTGGELYCFTTAPTAYRVHRRPSRIEIGQPSIAFAVGGSHACALGADGFAYCWGLSHLAQVGRPPRGT